MVTLSELIAGRWDWTRGSSEPSAASRKATTSGYVSSTRWSLVGVSLGLLLITLGGCGSGEGSAGATNDAAVVADADASTDAEATADAALPVADAADAQAARSPDPFADRIVAFTPGPTAGFGQDRLPGVVLGPPQGAGAGAGSLDVLSLGRGGCIVLEFTDIVAVDGPGVDILVSENPWGTWFEPAIVSVSEDGNAWSVFPCATADSDAGFPGCAGVRPVFTSPENGISAVNPTAAGGDRFDLHDVGLSRARFVRVCDAGVQHYGGIAGGFDLDAVTVVNGAVR